LTVFQGNCVSPKLTMAILVSGLDAVSLGNGVSFSNLRSLLTLDSQQASYSTNNSTISSTHSNEIHFLPPSKDNNITAWIIVGVVVGTIIIVFILILVIRQLLSMFRNRDYESITNSSSNEHKSLFENYNNGHININIDYNTNGTLDTSQTQHTADTNVSSVYQATRRKRSKEQRKHTHSHSQSKSTVNFVSSDEDKDEADDNRDKPRNKNVVIILDEADEDRDSEEDDEEEYYDEEEEETEEQQIDRQAARIRSMSQRSAVVRARAQSNSTSMGFTASDND